MKGQHLVHFIDLSLLSFFIKIIFFLGFFRLRSEHFFRLRSEHFFHSAQPFSVSWLALNTRST